MSVENVNPGIVDSQVSNVSVVDCHLPSLAVVSLVCIRGDRPLTQPLNFTLSPGSILEVGGPNGCGKTTLLRTLCGLVAPEVGEVRWGNARISAAGADFLSQLSYVGHMDGIKSELTVWENIRLASALHGSARDPLPALERLGIGHIRNRMTRYLSAGQRRRLALARLLVADSTLWLLDEPFTALDRDGTKMVTKLIEDHTSGGGICVFTSHHPVSVVGAERLHLEPLPIRH